MLIINTELEAIVSKDQSRYALQGINYNKNKRRLEATNGKIAAILPAGKDQDDEGGVIPLEAVKQCRKRGNESLVKLNGNVNVGSASYEKLEGAYPNIDKLLKSVKRGCNITKKREPDLIIDAEFLMNLAKALTAKGKHRNYQVKLYFPSVYGEAIYVEPVKNEYRAVGVIMPCSK